jgi:SOS-response transcriptional repressor LexA
VTGPLGAGLVRMRDASMAPRVPAGAWLAVDWRRTPRAGDLVLAVLDDELAVRGLVEWAGRRWLVAAGGAAAVPAGPEAEIRGVVTGVLPGAAPARPITLAALADPDGNPIVLIETRPGA